MSKTRLISSLAAGLGILLLPLMAAAQTVADAAGVTVTLNGSTVLHRTPVNYPVAALQHGVQGTLSVEVKLDSTGNVSDARVLSGPDELRNAALQSVLQWHFTRDAAGTTRQVQIAFELPKPGAEAEAASSTTTAGGYPANPDISNARWRAALAGPHQEHHGLRIARAGPRGTARQPAGARRRRNAGDPARRDRGSTRSRANRHRQARSRSRSAPASARSASPSRPRRGPRCR